MVRPIDGSDSYHTRKCNLFTQRRHLARIPRCVSDRVGNWTKYGMFSKERGTPESTHAGASWEKYNKKQGGEPGTKKGLLHN